MSKCVVCGQDSGKAECCSGACRAKKARRTPERTRTVDNEAHAPERTNLEVCRFCGLDLPKLSKPRRWPGACYECALKQPVRDGDDLWPEFRYDQRPFTEQPYKMTVYEREHYKPVAKLDKGQFNPVSKPGDVGYAGDAEVQGHAVGATRSKPPGTYV